MDKYEAQYRFWSSFGWPAYDAYSVPDDAKLPYITYNSVGGDFEQIISVTASLWDRSPSWESVQVKANEIEAFINQMGCPKIDGGRMRVFKGATAFAQCMNDPNDNEIRRVILNVNIEFMAQL